MLHIIVRWDARRSDNDQRPRPVAWSNHMSAQALRTEA